MTRQGMFLPSSAVTRESDRAEAARTTDAVITGYRGVSARTPPQEFLTARLPCATMAGDDIVPIAMMRRALVVRGARIDCISGFRAHYQSLQCQVAVCISDTPCAVDVEPMLGISAGPAANLIHVARRFLTIRYHERPQ